MDIEAIRFEKNMPNLGNIAPGSGHRTGITQRRLLSNGMHITETLLPGPYKALAKCAEVLGMGNEIVEGYVYSEPDHNAWCISHSTGHTIFAVSSSLVKILNQDELEFLIGHELGHSVLGHSEAVHFMASEADYKLLGLLRDQEISADRCGFICAGSLESSISAIMKMATGLDEADLKLDIRSFIDQCKKLEYLPVGIAHQYSTHPSLPVRARALLWFSVAGSLKEDSGQFHINKKGIKESNQHIEGDLKRYMDEQMEASFVLNKKDFRMFFHAQLFSQDGGFNKQEGEFLVKSFGERATVLFSMLEKMPKNSVPEFLMDKAKAIFMEMEAYSKIESQEELKACLQDTKSGPEIMQRYTQS